MADVNEQQAARERNGLPYPTGASAPVLADAFNRKVESHLGDRVILKPLTRWNEAYKEFPRYVMEYLVSRYVDVTEPFAGQRKIDKILSEHYTESAKKELIKSRIKENGEYTLLGQLTVRLDQARDHYWADVPALGDNTVRVGPKILEQYREVLMTSGAWGTMVIEYDATYEIKSRKYPFYVREFTPLQYTRLDLDDYIAKRPLFTEDEWLDLLVQSIGFNPARFDRRVKMLMLLRLVPFVEANYNLIELGPRETGKTYTFRNTSNRSFVVSGGKATPATLFYNKATRKLGVIGLKQVVFFDEIASTRFDDAEASVSVLKDYMQTGKFSRGDQEFSAQCSVVLGGNIDTDVEQREPEPHYRHLFEVLPVELQDAAFLDRIHAYLPGWEMPKIRPENYATGYGFLTDYMAEIFSELRRRNFQTHVAAWVDLSGMTGRNQDAIKKTVAGLLKLQHLQVEFFRTCQRVVTCDLGGMASLIGLLHTAPSRRSGLMSTPYQTDIISGVGHFPTLEVSGRSIRPSQGLWICVPMCRSTPGLTIASHIHWHRGAGLVRYMCWALRYSNRSLTAICHSGTAGSASAVSPRRKITGRSGSLALYDLMTSSLNKSTSHTTSVPQGLDTVVGEGGSTLSAGEQLRITIARAFLRDAPILLLDEPTSALDAATEARVMQGLETLMAGRTTFVIAHRLSTVRRADTILVLQNGQIAEQGSFAGLVTRGEIFATLYQMQFETLVLPGAK